MSYRDADPRCFEDKYYYFPLKIALEVSVQLVQFCWVLETSPPIKYLRIQTWSSSCSPNLWKLGLHILIKLEPRNKMLLSILGYHWLGFWFVVVMHGISREKLDAYNIPYPRWSWLVTHTLSIDHESGIEWHKEGLHSLLLLLYLCMILEPSIRCGLV